MDLDRLPDNVCVKILSFLMLRQQIRVARVSRRFKYLSDVAISQRESISLNSALLDLMGWESWWRIAHSCADDLKKLAFHASLEKARFVNGSTMRRGIKAMSEIRYPRLVSLRIFDAEIDIETLRTLLANCPRLRQLVLVTNDGQIPSMVGEFGEEDDTFVFHGSVDMFESVIDHFPRIKHLGVVLPDASVQWHQVLNKTFAKRPELEKLALQLDDAAEHAELQVGQLGNLFGLRSLRSLTLAPNIEITDQSMADISSSFLELEVLELKTYFETWHGLGALSKLKNLRVLDVIELRRWTGGPVLDDGLRQLARSECLQIVEITFTLWPETVLAFVHHCPRLQLLSMPHIHELSSEAQIREFVRGLKGFVQQDLTIRVWFQMNVRWRTREIRIGLDLVVEGRVLSLFGISMPATVLHDQIGGHARRALGFPLFFAK